MTYAKLIEGHLPPNFPVEDYVIARHVTGKGWSGVYEISTTRGTATSVLKGLVEYLFIKIRSSTCTTMYSML
jgi:hypothetical protein